MPEEGRDSDKHRLVGWPRIWVYRRNTSSVHFVAKFTSRRCSKQHPLVKAICLNTISGKIQPIRVIRVPGVHEKSNLSDLSSLFTGKGVLKSLTETADPEFLGLHLRPRLCDVFVCQILGMEQ
jgi:hypothetical protein